ncbi:hypothetical protein GEU84_020245 [Fertoebacter nigrum]|uniref:Uncharacterized protein n=1 Tax=Fertoeibacter niger TaxID=2656921 RepID=A0A8X8H5B4_9RHOB|nr:hypothetical protein [Fertoeibacter niger]NUB46727.1 hypothetical protein [Fertoeibacter niger]
MRALQFTPTEDRESAKKNLLHAGFRQRDRPHEQLIPQNKDRIMTLPQNIIGVDVAEN